MFTTIYIFLTFVFYTLKNEYDFIIGFIKSSNITDSVLTNIMDIVLVL